jgi:RNA polymerase sigma factor (sigma-70 family)
MYCDVAMKGHDLDLSLLGDEELVVLAQECGFQPARDELLVRYHDWTNRLIAYKARSTRLGAADVLDAQQNATFSIIEAIGCYDVTRFDEVNGCSFRSFLRRVLGARFRDFVRGMNRREQHYDSTARTPQALEEGASAAAWEIVPCAACPRSSSNPAAAVEWREALAHLHQALQALPERDRRLWEALASGKELRTLATELGISYDCAKRLRRKVLAQLTAQLRGGQD